MIYIRKALPWLPLGCLYLVFFLNACSGNSEEIPPPADKPIQPTATGEERISPILSKAQALLAEGKFQEAVHTCQKGLAIDSTSISLLNIMATAYASEGRYALAIEALKQMQSLQPERALTYLNLGGIYTKLGQYEQAEILLMQALELAPKQPEIHRRLGEVYLGTDRFEKATHHFSLALGLFPHSSTLHYYLGRAYEGMGEGEAALKSFTHSTGLDSGFPECFYRIAQMARRMGRNELARESMLKFQRLQRIGGGDPDIPKQMKKLRASILNAPESPIHHEKLGHFFAQHDYLSEAENLYQLTSQLPGVELERLTRMGKHMLRLERPQTALLLFQKAAQRKPQHIPTLLNAGVALEMLGKTADAQTYYRRVQQLSPKDPRGWYALGLSEFNAGRLSSAQVAWEKSLLLTASNTPLHREIKQRLEGLNSEN